MPRATVLAVIALALAAYGVYTALYIPAMFIGPATPLLIACFVAQFVFALAASAGLWLHRRWVGVALLLFAAAITVTQIAEVVLGIVPYLRAILVSFLVIAGALVLAAYASRAQPLTD